MRRPLRAAPVALALLALTPNPGSSQSRGFLGLSIERFYEEDARFTAVNLRLTQMSPGRVGVDLNAGLVPVALQGGLLFLDLDVGLAKALAIGLATLLLGLHTESEFYPGLQGGLAAVVPVQRRVQASGSPSFPRSNLPASGPCPSPDPEAQ